MSVIWGPDCTKAKLYDFYFIDFSIKSFSEQTDYSIQSNFNMATS